MKQKLSNYIAEKLLASGITDVFMITGGGAMHLNDSLGHHPGLSCLYQHHEQAAAMAAEAYARVDNRMAAVWMTRWGIRKDFTASTIIMSRHVRWQRRRMPASTTRLRQCA